MAVQNIGFLHATAAVEARVGEGGLINSHVALIIVHMMSHISYSAICRPQLTPLCNFLALSAPAAKAPPYIALDFHQLTPENFITLGAPLPVHPYFHPLREDEYYQSWLSHGDNANVKIVSIRPGDMNRDEMERFL